MAFASARRHHNNIGQSTIDATYARPRRAEEHSSRLVKRILAMHSTNLPPVQLRRWLLESVEARRRSRLHLRLCSAATTIQSAIRASLARRHCSLLREARLLLWVGRATAIVAAEHGRHRPSPLGEELWLDAVQASPSLQGHVQVPIGVPSQCLIDRVDDVNRALSEALAPGMGNPPPGCPGALDVNWEDWGVKLRLKFPPRSGDEGVFPGNGGDGINSRKKE